MSTAQGMFGFPVWYDDDTMMVFIDKATAEIAI
jgi:hypothetical protein